MSWWEYCIVVGCAVPLLGLFGWRIVERLAWWLRVPTDIDGAEAAVRDVVDRALAAGVPRGAVWRGAHRVPIRYASIARPGTHALHSGGGIKIDPDYSGDVARLVAWETAVNGIGRKWRQTRGKSELSRERHFKALGVI